MESKNVPQSVDNVVSHIERLFNKLYTDARICISKCDLSKLDIEKQRKKDSGGICLEKVKFNMFSEDIRKYPCFRKEFIRHIKLCCSKEEEGSLCIKKLS